MSVIRLPNNDVQIISDNLVLTCNQQFGGAPLSCKYKGQELIDTFPGAGINAVWETGNDPTLAGANGFLPFPIATTTNKNPEANYYRRESVFSSNLYQTAGFAPFFWGSHEGIDDSIPVESYPCWCTKYHNILGLDPDTFTGAASQIYFVPTAKKKSALFFIGDELKSTNNYWASRLCPIANGNVAAKTRISFKQSSSDGYGGICFRKDIPPTANEAQAYNAPGFHFLVNRSGQWALHVLPANTVITSGVLPKAQIAKLKTTGVTLEVRTHTVLPGTIELYYDGVLLQGMDNAPVLKGTAFGYLAACNSGIIEIADRAVFDLNLALTMTVKPLVGGKISLSFELNKSAGNPDPIMLYRCGLGGFFFNLPYLANSNLYHNPMIGPVSGPNPGIIDLAVGDMIRLVNEKLRFNIELTELVLNNAPAANAHGLLARLAGGPQSIAHLNTLPESANQNPVPVFQSKMTYTIEAI